MANVIKGFIFKDGIEVGGNANVAGTFRSDGAVTIANSLAVGSTSVTGLINVTSTANVGGDTNLRGALTVNGATIIVNTVAIGNTSITGFINATSSANIGGAANIAGTIQVGGAATFGSTLSVTGSTTVTGFLNAISSANVGGTLNVAGVTNIGNILNVGNTTVTGFINATSSANIAGALTVGGNVVISGNLIVSGTTTYVNTATLNVADNIVTLNADLPSGSAPTENAGIEVNRGSSANSVLRWNETTDVWEISPDGTTFGRVLSKLADVALGTDTSGNYVATVASGNGVSISGSGAETAAVTVTAVVGNGMGLDTNGIRAVAGNSQLVSNTTGIWITQGNIDHNSLSNYAASRHIDHTAVSITAGNGLTGGGAIDASRTIDVGQGNGITVGTDTIFVQPGNGVAVDTNGVRVVAGNSQLVSNTTGVWITQTNIDHNSLSNYVAGRHIDHTAVSITAGNGLTGGGNIDASRTIDIGQGNGISVGTDAISVLPGNGMAVDTNGVRVVAGNSQLVSNTTGIWITQTNIDHNSLSNYAASRHIDHTAVSITAGNGLTGGGAIDASRTLDIGQGNGITVGTDTIFVRPSNGVAVDTNGVSAVAGNGNIVDTNGIRVVAGNNQLVSNTTGVWITQGNIDHNSLGNYDANRHVDHTQVSVTAGSGLTGGGTIDTTKTINVGQGNGITVDTDTIYVRPGNGMAVDTNGVRAVAGNNQLVSNVTGIWITQSNIDHNSLGNYDANRHVDHTAVSITAGSGLTGGGNIDTSRTINVGQGNGITVGTDTIFVQPGNGMAVDTNGVRAVAGNTQLVSNVTGLWITQSNIDHNALANYDGNRHFDHTQISITAGSGLTGGGTISDNRTLNVGQGNGVTVDTDTIYVRPGNGMAVDTNGVRAVAGNTQLVSNVTGIWITQSNIDHNALANYDGNRHFDHTQISVTAGNGLTGGGTISDNRTIDVGQGNGITVGTDAISVRAGNAISVDTNGVNVVAGGGIVSNNSGVHHLDTSSVTNLTASGRTYVTGLSFDTYGHVTGYTTGTETVTDTDTNTTYSVKASVQTGGAGIDLDAGGSGSGTDTVKILGSGQTTVTQTNADTITISSSDQYTGTVTGVSGTTNRITSTGGTSPIIDLATHGAGAAAYSSGISAISVDAYGRVTSVTGSANYLTSAVTSVAGTTNRITSSGGATPTIDLATHGAGAATYSSGISAITVDAYGRVTSVTGTANYLTSVTNITGSAGTFTSTTQNSQFNSIGVNTAASGTAGAINATGNITAADFIISSDDRLKTREGNIQNALAAVNTLNGFKFTWNQEAVELRNHSSDVTRVGISAQEVEAILPEAVYTDDDGYKTVSYDSLVPLLIEAVKELTEKVARLEAK